MEIAKPQFTQAGSVLRMKFQNFMQYEETEVHFGPNLNVIIGPNGTGKSTIVNGICLGLAGKTNVLGRASRLTDYIMIGKKEALLEIELYMPRGDNLIISRYWTSEGKTDWRVNGKKTTEKDVRDRVAKLSIQVDNLCQFLPQDKVHDFSRLNNKGLLDSTVDAVGDTGLKEKHEDLKQYQKEYDDGEVNYRLKEKTFAEMEEKSNKMEDAVKAFEQKKTLMEKFESLQKKKLWCEFFKNKAEFLESKKYCEEKKKTLEAVEKEIAPLEKEIKEIKQKITKIQKIKKSDDEEKDHAQKARIHGRNIENFIKLLDTLEDEESDRLRRLKEKQKKVVSCQREIKELETEARAISAGHQETDMLEKLREAKANTEQATQQLYVEKEKREQKGFEISNKNAEKKGLEQEMTRLKDMENRKLDKLKERNVQVYQAVQWYRNNKENFRGQVYEPFVLSANIPDQNHAVYVENTIGHRDMFIFFFEDSDDMNRFLNIVRGDKGLEQVGAALVNRYSPGGSHSLDKMQPRVAASTLHELGLVSYVSSMVRVAEPVLAYMCHQYNMHNTAVFQPASEKYNDNILKQGISRYFFGRKFQMVSRSSYSGKLSTRTSEVSPRNLMSQSLDQDRIHRVSQQLQDAEEVVNSLMSEFQTLELNCKHLNIALETRKKEQRDVEQKRIHIQKIMKAIERKQNQLKEAQSTEEEQQEKIEIDRKKKETIMSLNKTKNYLFKVVQASVDLEEKKCVKCVGLGPLEHRLTDREDQKARKLEDSREVRQEVNTLEAQLDLRQKEMIELLKDAKTATGLDPGSKAKPPVKYTEYWNKEKFPDNVVEIDQLLGELDAQLSCTESVDANVLGKYRQLKENMQDCESQLKQLRKTNQRLERMIDEVKEDWLNCLNDLINNINLRFSRFLAQMGFAGAVQLDTGKSVNDFDNYGIKILVKYRDYEDLQELDAHRQSGGERSVATAIYMLALQALTTVPFRCVDEINQGMDSRNERLVFDLLVHTSCQESDAQYFLLTPKLLNGLTYNPKMTVLTVHNGQDMAHYSEWGMDAFIQRFGELRGN